MLGHPLAATIGDSARCMQNLEKVLFTRAKDLRHGDVYLRLGLSVGEMTLRLYGALNYSPNSVRDLRCALNGA